MMCATSTSVSSERLFSRTGATVTARRAKLTDDHVEMLIYIYIHDNLKIRFLKSFYSLYSSLFLILSVIVRHEDFF